jgi:hypothetical protein
MFDEAADIITEEVSIYCLVNNAGEKSFLR